MARLQIDWGAVNGFRDQSLDQWNENDEGAQPSLFYLTTDEPRSKSRVDMVERTVLADERVATAAKFFNCVKINGDSLEEDHPLYGELKGGALPRMVVVSSDGSKIGKVEGKISPSRLYGLMKKSTQKEYVTRLDVLVKNHRNMLNELDKLEGQKRVLASKEERAKGKVNRDIRKMREEIAEKEKELQDFEAKLFDIKRRADKS